MTAAASLAAGTADQPPVQAAASPTAEHLVSHAAVPAARGEDRLAAAAVIGKEEVVAVAVTIADHSPADHALSAPQQQPPALQIVAGQLPTRAPRMMSVVVVAAVAPLPVGWAAMEAAVWMAETEAARVHAAGLAAEQ